MSESLPPAASFYVPSLPDIHQDPTHPLTIFAGHIPSDPNASTASPNDLTAHLYFVLVKNRRIADRERVMFWFNGGPGCSSFDGLMMEVGPWRMDGKGGFVVQEGGWEEYTTMIYVDQPAGTGYSYTSSEHYIHTLPEASAQFITFLTNFYKIFPEYQHTDTYLGGESYAGQYIPYFAKSILDGNAGGTLNVKLKGIAIGNGWIDGRAHYASYIEFATKVGLLKEGSDDWKNARQKTDDCLAKYDRVVADNGGSRTPITMSGCEELIMDVAVSKEQKIDGQDMCINIYDIRLTDTSPSCGMNWPPDIKPVTTYLSRSDVTRALHASPLSKPWVECRGLIQSEMRERDSNSSVTLLPGVLDGGVEVLVFAGDQDLICNYVGQEGWIRDLEWGGGRGLGTVETRVWSVGGKGVGTWVGARGLTYVKIFNASHMAPFDVPHITHDMILRFMGVDFGSIVNGSARIPSSVGDDVKPIFAASSQNPSSDPNSNSNSNSNANSGANGGSNGANGGKTGTDSSNKAMWEAYYNAGSAALVLVLIFIAISTFLWCRFRSRRHGRGSGGWLRRGSSSGNGIGLPMHVREVDGEESIPLTRSTGNGDTGDEESIFKGRKGKEKALEPVVFEVGDGSDVEDGEEGGYRDR